MRSRRTTEGQTAPSIGRPITNATALILDGALRPVPPGEPGELCLAGALVGRGYRNDPELTASRFVTVAAGDGAYAGDVRVYRTGDQVRLLENGEIAFLGRLDKQVKIRGFRIEPAEIVAAIDRFPGVAASAVVAHRTSDDDPDAPAEPELVGVRRDRRRRRRTFRPRPARLPRRPGCPSTWSRPGSWASTRLPLTINGKLDEAALPAKAAENLLPGSGRSRRRRRRFGRGADRRDRREPAEAAHDRTHGEHLPARRALHARDAARAAHPAGLRREAGPAAGVRGTHRRGPGRRGRPGGRPRTRRQADPDDHPGNADGRRHAQAPLSLYHLLDPEVLANPYPLYQRLRTEDPVHWDPYLHAWIVTRYEDVATVFRRFSADRTPAAGVLRGPRRAGGRRRSPR